ncbi:MAG: glycerophosphodiester phosphodiesterase [Anaerolineae bacterium]|nr:glycerophosphodiester phosphodiesterase [Anaerolineae bacterium]
MSFFLDRPLNFAHRGASYEAPANTLPAFLLAAEMGADGIEFDVQLSKDGEVVVIHDFTLDATTNGSGPVAEHTLAELKMLDAGGWFDPDFAGQQIPTLQEVIDTVGDCLLFNVEIKAAGLRDTGLVEAVVRLIEENGLLERVVVSSFNPASLWRVRRQNPAIPIGLLYAPDMPPVLRHAWLHHLVRPDAMHPYYATVSPAYVQWARKLGYRVNTWTVDDPGDMWRLVRMGVDVVITNRPETLALVLKAACGRLRPPLPMLPAPRRGGA